MSDDKDRLGDQLRKREHAEEDKYFAELSKKQVERLHEIHAAATADEMHCPRCGSTLTELHRHGAAADACPKGHGMWLDQSEIDLIAQREGDGWLARLAIGLKDDPHFAERSREQVARLRETHATAAGTAKRCPRCGTALDVVQRHGGAADACPKGHGMWLDVQEIERIRKREGEGWLARLLLGLKR
jgi:Zn-finger nucleic acid-binding protein